jgi:capsular exopolysaccharide synthesis family protein
MSSYDGRGPGSSPPPDVEPPFSRGTWSDGRDADGYGWSVSGVPEVHLMDYVRVLYRRRWTAITAFLLVTIAITVDTFTATPIYQAKTEILIEKENSNVVNFKEAYEQNQITDDYYQTQYKILQGRGLARRTMDALNLWNDAEFNTPIRQSTLSLRAMLNTVVGFVAATVQSRKPVEAPAAPAVPGADESAALSGGIDRFLGGLTITPIRYSRLVDVKYQSPSPRIAAAVANALAKSYIEQNLEFKFLASKEASDWLGERLAEQRQQVEASEQALQHYREQTDAVSLEERQNIVVQKLGDLNSAVTRAKTDRIQKEAAYNQISAVQNDRNALDSIPAILSNAFIQQQKADITELQRQQSALSDNLGPNHPDMRKVTTAIQQAQIKLQAETAKIVQSIKNDYQSALAQEQSLMHALDQQKQEAMALNRKGIDYGVLQRDAATNREVFNSLLQRAKETGISGELKSSNIRVVEPAELPRGPIYPDHTTTILYGCLYGTGFALLLVFFFEYMDNRIKNPDEIRTHLGVPFLGMVPALFGHDINDPLINNGVPANFIESVRAIRTNLLFSCPETGGHTIAVTSSGPGEGKTVIAVNLAMALAQSGARVLLIDADMRKSRAHEAFKLPSTPGLSNVIVGNAKASEAVRRTSVDNLWLLPAGVQPPNPPELLGSKRFVDFMTTLATHFDWVVVDTPPVMAVTDSCVAAHVTHAIVFVVGAEMTSRHAARRALEQLEHSKARLVGVVLNRVDLKHNGYYYSQYYRKEYSDYYSPSASA